MTNGNNPDLNEKIQEQLIEEFQSASLTREMVEEKLSEWPQSFFCHFLLGLLQKREKEFKDSLLSFQKANSLKPKTPGILNNIGEILHILNKRIEAISYFNECVKDNPGYIQGWTNLGIAYQNIGMFRDSEECYNRSLSLNPEGKSANMGLSQLFQIQDRHAEAIAILKNLEDDLVNDKDFMHIYASALFKGGEGEKALGIFKDISKRFGESADVLVNQVVILRSQKKYKKALEIILKAEESFPEELGPKIHTLGIYLDCRDLKKFKTFYSKLDQKFRKNINIDAMVNYVSSQKKGYPKGEFCSNPKDHVFRSNISDYTIQGENLIEQLKLDIQNLSFVREPSDKSTFKGSQTSKNLFLSENESFSILLKIIQIAVNKYKDNFAKSKSAMIKDWPLSTSIHGWAVILEEEGYQRPHIHPDGWLSGVIYLQIPETNENEGSLFFTTGGYDYPILNKSDVLPEKILKPSPGDVILFPSSLFHGTKPFKSGKERISIAFDIKPDI